MIFILFFENGVQITVKFYFNANLFLNNLIMCQCANKAMCQCYKLFIFGQIHPSTDAEGRSGYPLPHGGIVSNRFANLISKIKLGC
jgi:hypothetical protein